MLLKIDEFVAKFIPNRKLRYTLYCFVSILFICLIWFALTYLDFLDGIWEIFKKREIHYIFGIAIAIVSLVFGILILDVMKRGTAKNIDEFLELLNNFLKYANDSNVIVIVTPTLFIGGVNPDSLSDTYLANMSNLINQNSKVTIYSKHDISTFITQFDNIKKNDEDEIDKKSYLINENAKINELIKFHKKLFLNRSDAKKKNDPKDKVKYFERLIKFYKKFDDNSINNTDELQIILFLNESKNTGVLGVFSDNYNISGHNFKGENLTKALKSLVVNNVNER